jgi:hypothetical protein
MFITSFGEQNITYKCCSNFLIHLSIEPKDDGLTTPDATENKRIPVPEHIEPEQPKRGWLSRFFLPNG